MKYKLGKTIFLPEEDRTWSWKHDERVVYLTQYELITLGAVEVDCCSICGKEVGPLEWSYHYAYECSQLNPIDSTCGKCGEECNCVCHQTGTGLYNPEHCGGCDPAPRKLNDLVEQLKPLAEAIKQDKCEVIEQVVKHSIQKDYGNGHYSTISEYDIDDIADRLNSLITIFNNHIGGK